MKKNIKVEIQKKAKEANKKIAPSAICLCGAIFVLLIWFFMYARNLFPVILFISFFITFCVLSMTFIMTVKKTTILLVCSLLGIAISGYWGKLPIEFIIFITLIMILMLFVSKRKAEQFLKGIEKDIDIMQELKSKARTDYLTQVLNRSGLEEQSDIAWAFCKRYRKHAGVVIADIDHFKVYNDSWGHFEGDRILVRVAECIKTCFKRETDIVARIGGDEFLVFVSDVNEEKLMKLALELVAQIENLNIQLIREGEHKKLTASMGVVACVPEDEDEKSDLFKKADKLLYEAKRGGRNQVRDQEKVYQKIDAVETCEVRI